MTYVYPPGRRDEPPRLFRRKVRSLLKRVTQPLRNPSRQSRPAFVVGSGRSGTDLVCAKLGGLPEVQLVNEDNPAAFDNWRLRDLDIVKGVVERSWARVVLFKPIVETYRVRELLGAFDDGTAVFISRNPWDTVNSLGAFFGEGIRAAVDAWIKTDFEHLAHWPIPEKIRQTAARLHAKAVSVHDAAGIYWYLYNSAFHGLDLEADPRVTLTLYRDVVREPRTELARVAEHVGIPGARVEVHDIFPSSIGKHPPPPLAPDIAACCETTWRALEATAERYRAGSCRGSG